MQYDNTNSGALFKNDRKEQATHADYNGSINVNGVEFWINAWIKPMKNDASKRFMSLSVKPKQAQAPQTPPQRRAPKPASQHSGFDDMDSDIPF